MRISIYNIYQILLIYTFDDFKDANFITKQNTITKYEQIYSI